MKVKFIITIFLYAFFSYNAVAMDDQIRLTRKREGEDLHLNKAAKRGRLNLQYSLLPALHQKVNKEILKNGYLIEPSQRDRALKLHLPQTKFARTHPVNDFGVSLVGAQDGCFALHPGKAILGQGQKGKVKLAQIVYLDPADPLTLLFKAGDWIAIKIQHDEFEDEEIEGLMRSEFLIANPFIYEGKDGTPRYACPIKLITGPTLQDWLLDNDPDRSFDLKYFLKLTNRLNDAVADQFHQLLMSFKDKNLENMIVEEKTSELIFIDFGNVFLFDHESENFYRSCDEDFAYITAAVFEHLYMYYSSSLQDDFWIIAFKQASRLNLEDGAFTMLFHIAQALPPFLEAIYGEQGPKHIVNDDEIHRHIDDFLTKVGISQIQ